MTTLPKPPREKLITQSVNAEALYRALVEERLWTTAMVHDLLKSIRRYERESP